MLFLEAYFPPALGYRTERFWEIISAKRQCNPSSSCFETMVTFQFAI